MIGAQEDLPVNRCRLFFSYQHIFSEAHTLRRDTRKQLKRLLSGFTIHSNPSSVFSSEGFHREFMPSIDYLGRHSPSSYVVVTFIRPDRNDKKTMAVMIDEETDKEVQRIKAVQMMEAQRAQAIIDEENRHKKKNNKSDKGEKSEQSGKIVGSGKPAPDLVSKFMVGDRAYRVKYIDLKLGMTGKRALEVACKHTSKLEIFYNASTITVYSREKNTVIHNYDLMELTTDLSRPKPQYLQSYPNLNDLGPVSLVNPSQVRIEHDILFYVSDDGTLLAIDMKEDKGICPVDKGVLAYVYDGTDLIIIKDQLDYFTVYRGLILPLSKHLQSNETYLKHLGNYYYGRFVDKYSSINLSQFEKGSFNPLAMLKDEDNQCTFMYSDVSALLCCFHNIKNRANTIHLISKPFSISKYEMQYITEIAIKPTSISRPIFLALPVKSALTGGILQVVLLLEPGYLHSVFFTASRNQQGNSRVRAGLLRSSIPLVNADPDSEAYGMMQDSTLRYIIYGWNVCTEIDIEL